MFKRWLTPPVLYFFFLLGIVRYIRRESQEKTFERKKQQYVFVSWLCLDSLRVPHSPFSGHTMVAPLMWVLWLQNCTMVKDGAMLSVLWTVKRKFKRSTNQKCSASRPCPPKFLGIWKVLSQGRAIFRGKFITPELNLDYSSDSWKSW